MKILVTGGAGYVGSLLIPALLDKGHSITVLDWFLFEPRQFSRPLPRLKCVVGDLRDENKVKESLENVETVIHLAGISNDPSSELNPQATRDINYKASCRLVDLAQQSGVGIFINASSASVYGIREEENITEELEPRPQTIYARCKAEGEAYVLSSNRRDFLTTSVRPATLSGFAPRMRLDLTVNILTYHAVCKNFLQVFGGAQYRPNLSVKDMIRLYLLLLETAPEKIAGQTFNVCQENYTVLEIAEKIREALGESQMEIRHVPTADNRSYRLSGERARCVLGFVPAFDLEDSIKEVASALRDGRIKDPANIRYRNVEWLKQYDLSEIDQVSEIL
jgi:nucleoside-diphosphate-sugar epimerase